MSIPAKPGIRFCLKRWLTRVLAGCVWLVVWQLASIHVNNAILIASPIETLIRFVELVQSASFWSSMWTSLARILSSFVLAFVVALVLAGIAQMSQLIELLLHPCMLAMKATPVACIVVILLIWLGSNMVVQVAVVLVVLPALYFSALEGLHAQDASRKEMLCVFRVGILRRLLVFVWPSLKSYLIASCEMVVGMSWKAGIAAELIGMPLGSVGERIYQSKLLLLTADLFAWTVAVVLAAYVCEHLVLWLLSRSFELSRRLALFLSQRSAHGSIQPVALGLDRVRVSFDAREVLHDCTLSMPKGSRTCLLDPSGTGKTTVLRLLAGVLQPSAGCVVRTGRVSMAWQSTCLLEDLSAVDNVCLMAGCSVEVAHELLEELLPQEVHNRPVSQLSGGERRRVEVVRALAASSNAVLLDEPFASLDEQAHMHCAAFICKHIHNRTLVVATHDVNDVALLSAHEAHLAGVPHEKMEAPSKGSAALHEKAEALNKGSAALRER